MSTHIFVHILLVTLICLSFGRTSESSHQYERIRENRVAEKPLSEYDPFYYDHEKRLMFPGVDRNTDPDRSIADEFNHILNVLQNELTESEKFLLVCLVSSAFLLLALLSLLLASILKCLLSCTLSCKEQSARPITIRGAQLLLPQHHRFHRLSKNNPEDREKILHHVETV